MVVCCSRAPGTREDAVTSKICVRTCGERIYSTKIGMYHTKVSHQILQDETVFLRCWSLVERLILVQAPIDILRTTASVIGAPALEKVSAIHCRVLVKAVKKQRGSQVLAQLRVGSTYITITDAAIGQMGQIVLRNLCAGIVRNE